MSNATELAEAIVELLPEARKEYPDMYGIEGFFATSTQFINDGRVVLALMEKWIKHSHTSLAVNAYEEGYWATAVRYRHNGDEEEAPRHYQANHPGSPGRAIVEACVSALREKSDE